MLTRIICLAAFAAVAGTQLMLSPAEARGRICFPFFICPHSPPSDNGDYEPGYEGDEPVYIAPRKKKTAKAALAPKPSGTLVEKKAVSSTGKNTARAATTISCAEAEKIVSGYAFASVTPTTCTGQVFAFNGSRSGKSYVIKLSSASGELTEVNEIQ